MRGLQHRQESDCQLSVTFSGVPCGLYQLCDNTSHLAGLQQSLPLDTVSPVSITAVTLAAACTADIVPI